MTGAWINAKAYGMFRCGTVAEYGERTTLRSLAKTDGLLAYPVRNHGRFSPMTQRVFCLTALALRDAGIEYAEGRRFNIGLLSTDAFGSAEANRDYFKDYIDGGRILARANLFIYTLPSSPMAEASVHFGLQGPLLYLRPSGGGLAVLLKTAGRMLAERQAERMLIYHMKKDAGRCVLLESGDEESLAKAEGLLTNEDVNDEG